MLTSILVFTEIRCNDIPQVANGTADKQQVKVDETIAFTCLRGFKWEDNSTEKERSYQCISIGLDNVTLVGSPPDCIG